MENNDRRLDLVDFKSITKKDSIDGYRVVKVLGEVDNLMCSSTWDTKETKSISYWNSNSPNRLILSTSLYNLITFADELGANAILNYKLKILEKEVVREGTAVIIEKIEETENIEGDFAKKYF